MVLAIKKPSFRWNPDDRAVNQLRLSLPTLPAVSLIVRAGSAVPVIESVVNAASGAAGFAANGIASIYGARLAGAQVAVDGVAVTVLYTSASQINFDAPAMATGAATLTVTAPSGETASAPVQVAAVQPGIFTAMAAGQTLIVYATGLGPAGAAPLVFIGATPVQPAVLPVAPGVWQLNAPIPAGVSGAQPVLISVSLAHSNTVRVTIP